MAKTNGDRAQVVPAAAHRPWTVVAVVVLMFAVLLARMWADRFALTFSKTSGASYLVTYSMLAITLALIADGLWRRSRNVWALAILWLLIDAGYGALHIATNGYGWDAVTSLTQVGFYEGAVPMVVGAINLVLLLLPVTRAWVTRPPS
jgi:hypothetical protein